MLPERRTQQFGGKAPKLDMIHQGTILLSARVALLEDQRICTMMYE